MTDLEQLLISGVTATPRPWYSGAVALIAHGGQIEQIAAVGHTARFADTAGTAAPRDIVRPVSADTVFDLASITKVFVSATLLSLVDDDLLALDEPVATWLPSFANGERRAVTLRRLMTHTSGLSATVPLWTGWASRPDRVAALLNAPLVHTPGTFFEYSCVGYLVAGLLAERVTDRPLDQLVDERVCAPLELTDTGYLPSPDQVARAAATEYQPVTGRGLVRGQVHDENSWSIGGIGGNAGIFGTAVDLARFAEMLRGHGALGGVRVLAENTVAEMTRDQMPASMNPGFRHGLGVRIADPNFMGVLADGGAYGHTGFTGTSLVVDPNRELVVIVLTNRVHPSREWSDITQVRQGAAALAAQCCSASSEAVG